MALKKKKQPKRRSQLKPVKKTKEESLTLDESPGMLWLMTATKSWCNVPAARSERTARKKHLGDIMQVEVQSVKAFYNYGQIKSKHVFPVLSAVTGIPEEDMIFIFQNYPYLKDKMNDLPPEKRRLFSLIAQLSEKEIFMLNRLLEAGLEANKALQSETDEE